MMFMPTSRNAWKRVANMCFTVYGAHRAATKAQVDGREAGKGAPDHRARPEQGDWHRECAIFRTGIPHGISGPWRAVPIDPRRATEVTATSPGLKYCKIRIQGFLRGFPAGRMKTSDFLRTKYGCLPTKVRMFCVEKSDVFEAKTAKIRTFCPHNLHFSKGNGHFSPFYREKRNPNIGITTLQNIEKQPHFRSGTVAEVCQHF